MFDAIGRLVVAHKRAVLLGYALLLPLLVWMGASVFPRLKAGGFEDPSRESWQAFSVMQRELGAGTGDIIALYTSTGGTVEEPEVMGEILAVVTQLEQDPDVGAVQSAWSTGAPHFMSRDRMKTFLFIDLKGDEQKKTEAYRRLVPTLTAPGLTLQIGGLIPSNTAIFETIRADLVRAELFAFPLTALIVLLVFGSLASVAVLVAVGGVSVALAFAALRVLVSFSDVSVFAVNTITILGLGLAVDYSLFLVNRFREELTHKDVDAAILHTMKTTGRAVAFSAITVAASLCGLFAFEHMMLRSLALGGVFVVLCTMVLSLTLVPALLAVLGPRIDALKVPFLHRAAARDTSGDNLWSRTARRVMKRPVLVTVAVAAVLLGLGAPFQRFEGSLADTRLLPAGDPVRATHAVLDAEFLKNQSTPHLVLATVQGEAMTRENLTRLAQLSKELQQLPGVSRVDGVFTFVAGASSEQVIDGLLKLKPDDPSRAELKTLVSGSLMRFSLLTEHPFDHATSQQHVVAIRALSGTPAAGGAQVQLAGYAAALWDLKQVVRERAPLMVLGVLAAMAVILFLVFGSITLPFKAMAMNALSLTASFGAIVWIFQDGRFTDLLGYAPLGFSDSTQPLVMFATAFGLSMDYEVLILSRVREEYVRRGGRPEDNEEAVALGIGHTGRLITSAAALLVVVVGAFATSQILFMKALGVGMALAIAIDATVVRALLVPAAMKLMGEWNWYAPAFLHRLWKKSGMSDVEH